MALAGETPLPLSSVLFIFWSPMYASRIHNDDPSYINTRGGID